MAGGTVQVPGAEHLRPQHLPETLPGLVRQCGVGEYADAVDDAGQRRQLGVHAFQHGVHGLRVRHVGQFHLYPHASFSQGGDGLDGLGVRVAAPVQHDGARTPVGQPAGQGAADAAKASGYQIGAVLLQRSGLQRRVRQHDLADVARGAHELHRRSCLAHRPAGVDERRQLAGCQPLHHVSEGLPRPPGVVLLQNVELQNVIGHVRPRRGHVAVAVDIHPGQFDETPAGRQAGQARLDKTLAGQAVQHHVNAFTAGSREDFLPKRRAAAVEHVFHPQRPQVGLLRLAGGGEHFRARGMRKLDSRQPHTAGAGVNQHPLAGLQLRKVERQRRGDEHRRHRGQRRGGHVRRRRCHHFLTHHRLGTEGAERQGDDAVTGRDACDFCADFDHVAAHLAAQETFVDDAEGAEQVPEVETGGLDRDADFPWFQGTFRSGQHLQPFQGAARVGFQKPASLVGQCQPFGCGAGANQAGCLPDSQAKGNVGFGVGIHEFVDEVGQRYGVRGIEVEHPRVQMRRFPSRHLAQTPQRGAGQFTLMLAFQHLPAAGDEPDALPRGNVGVRRALHESQRAAACSLRSLAQFAGCRVGAAPVQRSQMHDAAEWGVAGQTLKQRAPRFSAVGCQRRSDDGGLAFG